jgi:hypothetical protein
VVIMAPERRVLLDVRRPLSRSFAALLSPSLLLPAPPSPSLLPIPCPHSANDQHISCTSVSGSVSGSARGSTLVAHLPDVTTPAHHTPVMASASANRGNGGSPSMPSFSLAGRQTQWSRLAHPLRVLQTTPSVSSRTTGSCSAWRPAESRQHHVHFTRFNLSLAS